MASYNLQKKESRDRLRAERQGELDAIERGVWPRNINDKYRWISVPSGMTHAEYAKTMCQADLAYLNDLEGRLDAGVQVWG